MKKKFLTTMLFFAFLFAGVQNASAQDQIFGVQYVNPTEAMTLLTTEIESIDGNAIYNQQQESHPQYAYLVRKLSFYTAVYEGIYVGNTIPTSILEGKEEANDIKDDSGETFDPYLQEIVTLLSQ